MSTSTSYKAFASAKGAAWRSASCVRQRDKQGHPRSCERGHMHQDFYQQSGPRAVQACAEADPDDSIEALESMTRSKRPSAREQREARRKEKKANQSYQVDSSIQDTLSGDLTDAQIFEGRVIVVLLSVFALSIVEGLALAGSGFLPEAGDQFVQDYVFKLFTPTVGLFLACSTFYGVWKSRQDGPSL